jgi:RND family efflux transporter MFP subunit
LQKNGVNFCKSPQKAGKMNRRNANTHARFLEVSPVTVPIRCVGRLLSWGILFLAGVTAGCSKGSPAPPAVEKPKAESELACTTLTPDACQSLGIVTVAVKNRPVQEHLPLTGWVMARQGNEVTLTAPVAGYVRDPSAAQLIATVGQKVRQGDPLLLIDPVLSPIEQVQLAALKRGVENELAKARESLLAAEAELNRVLDLARQGLRGQQDVEQARVRHRHAKEDIAAAEDKRKLFLAGAEEGARLPPVPVKAPRDGTILAVPVSPGQYVPAAAPLVTVADLSLLWVRVPVPEQYLPQLDQQACVRIAVKSATPPSSQGSLKNPEKPPPIEAKPVALVPLVDAVRHTADMIYELPAATGRPVLAKDQMVTAFVPLGRQSEETVVPYSAIVFDAYAGAWIYLEKEPKDGKQVYERRRVEVGASVDGGVVVRPCCKPGERVVVTGAAALFSREFFFAPVPTGTKQ